MRSAFLALVFALTLHPLLSAPAAPVFVVACLKVMPEIGDKTANYAVFEKLTRQAAAAGSKLVVTPEGYLEGYFGTAKGLSRERLLAIAEPVDGAWLKKVAALAKELRIHIVFGFTELSGDRVFNSAALFAPDGALLGFKSETQNSTAP